MHFLALDLEMNQPSGKIIQIGAAYGHRDTVVDLKYSCLVNPGETIDPRIYKLTGINDSHVANAPDILDAARTFADWIGSLNPQPFINPVTWGGGDSIELQRQSIPFRFGRRWIDVKTIHVFRCFRDGKKIQGGLSKVMIQYGLQFEGRKHDAGDDAVNTLRLFFRMMEG